MATRIEMDALGEVHVPAEAYWGSQAERSRQLFQLTGLTEHPRMIEAYIMLKKACAVANTELGLLDKAVGDALVQAADEILEGGLRDQFPVDVFHMGAGTSFNMNCNEVLANRAEEILGGKKGEYKIVKPNDHPNYGQSTNDTFPTAMRVMSRMMLEDLNGQVCRLEEALAAKGVEFDGVLKSARTHLQDAVPIRLGQEFTAYAGSVHRCTRWLEYAGHELEVLAIGGSAAGTGINTHPDYRIRVVELLAEYTGLPFRPVIDLREGMQSQMCMSALAASVRLLSQELTRITNDLRLLCSGPQTGLAEIVLPAVQPGSSIMPGKVNPSMAENMNMVLFQVMGQCHSIDQSVAAGQLELNVMMPGMAFSSQFMLQLLTNALETFTDNCIVGITANVDACRRYAEISPSLATALNPIIGYKAAAKIVEIALADGRAIPAVASELAAMPAAERTAKYGEAISESLGKLTPENMARALDPIALTEPGIPG
jgi:aspartate ammonia-lyase